MKKILKRIALFIVLTPVILLTISTVFYFVFALLAIGGESTEHQTYLKNNNEIIVIGTAINFKLFDKAFYENQIFLLGETHGFAMPQALDFELLKHLNQKADIQYYLAEVDYSQAHFLNRFLETGDERLLRYVFQTWVRENAQWGNKNYYDKIKNIYALNQTLPKEKKIKIIGVDKIQDVAVTNRFLKEILENIDYQNGTHPYLDTLQQLISTDTISIEKFASFAQHSLTFTEKDTSYKSILKTEAFNYLHTLRNIAYYNPGIRRDSVMYLNLKEVTHEFKLENAKMYGLWGFFHTLQVAIKRESSVLPFAALVKQQEDSPFRNKVVSLNIYAIDSENMLPGKMVPPAIGKGKAYFNTSWVNSNGPLVFVNGISDLKAITQQNSTTLFKIDSKASPYHASSRLANIQVLIPGQSLEVDEQIPGTSSAFQYVFLIRNSKALNPIEE